jgi:hypothetical protein
LGRGARPAQRAKAHERALQPQRAAACVELHCAELELRSLELRFDQEAFHAAVAQRLDLRRHEAEIGRVHGRRGRHQGTEALGADR